VVVSLMSLWGIAWLRCMQNVGSLRMLEECLTRCNLKNVVSCTAMILGLVKCGQGQKAL
jgi:hypothetical protein